MSCGASPNFIGPITDKVKAGLDWWNKPEPVAPPAPKPVYVAPAPAPVVYTPPPAPTPAPVEVAPDTSDFGVGGSAPTHQAETLEVEEIRSFQEADFAEFSEGQQAAVEEDFAEIAEVFADEESFML
eukprot:tig00000459_g1079.t1